MQPCFYKFHEQTAATQTVIMCLKLAAAHSNKVFQRTTILWYEQDHNLKTKTKDQHRLFENKIVTDELNRRQTTW